MGDQLFNKFYRVQNDLPLSGGFGIGLYLVKKFIESHSGSISYSSLNGAGTTFKVVLLKGKLHLSPNFIFEDVAESSVFLDELIESYDEASLDNKDLNAGKGKSPASVNINLESKSMLIVDDNVQIRELIQETEFSPLILKFLKQQDGLKGLELVYQVLPDIIISDVMMNGLSGIELCSRVKEDPSLNHIPVLLLTASSSPEIKLKGDRRRRRRLHEQTI